MTEKLVVFDFDGVLVTGTNEGYIRCYLKAMKNTGAISEQQEAHARKKILENWGSDYRTEIRSVVKDNEKFEETAKKYLENIETGIFWDYVKKAPFADESLGFLVTNGFVPVVLSGSPKDHIIRTMNHVNINPSIFKEIRSGVDYPKDWQKPQPFMLLDQMKKFGFDAGNTAYVGDAVQDLKMAKSAGVTSVTVLTGFLDRKTAESLGSDFILDDLRGLKEVLECM